VSYFAIGELAKSRDEKSFRNLSIAVDDLAERLRGWGDASPFFMITVMWTHV
jgi:hypothetical protein